MNEVRLSSTSKKRSIEIFNKIPKNILIEILEDYNNFIHESINELKEDYQGNHNSTYHLDNHFEEVINNKENYNYNLSELLATLKVLFNVYVNN